LRPPLKYRLHDRSLTLVLASRRIGYLICAGLNLHR
jgi:hypothetical protein